ncbi:hypothetical protein ALON55S_08760 [Alishewanella longhuensis]
MCEDILNAEVVSDKQAIQRIVHSFGLTGNLCLPALADSCAKLEHALRSTDGPPQAELLSNLVKQLCQSAELTRKKINNLPRTVAPVTAVAKTLPDASVLTALLNKLALPT